MKISIAAIVFALFAQPALAAESACDAITNACVKAGFKQGGAGTGVGLYVHCVQPLMEGTKQKKDAKKPLPKIPKATVASCKAEKGKK